MLHAELHGKVSENAKEVGRSEDVLTSTVFGVLFYVEARQVLVDWLGSAVPVGATAPLDLSGEVAPQYWFWPRLHQAEPDLVIRLGNHLLIIEAKFHAGKSGKDGSVTDDPKQVKDQLVREWRACLPDAPTSGYPRELREAIEACTLSLIYLVRRARLGPERGAVLESLKQISSARMYLLAWEDLDEVLAATTDGRPWVRELRAHLRDKRLSAFRGFVQLGVRPCELPAWRFRSERLRQFERAFSTDALPTLRALTTWRYMEKST